MILHEGNVEIDVEYKVGQRVHLVIKSSSSSFSRKAIIIGVKAVARFTHLNTLAGDAREEKEYNVYYTFLTDDHAIYDQEAAELRGTQLLIHHVLGSNG